MKCSCHVSKKSKWKLCLSLLIQSGKDVKLMRGLSIKNNPPNLIDPYDLLNINFWQGRVIMNLSNEGISLDDSPRGIHIFLPYTHLVLQHVIPFSIQSSSLEHGNEQSRFRQLRDLIGGHDPGIFMKKSYIYFLTKIR